MNDRLIPTTIVEALDRGGALTVDSLYKRVKKLHGDPGSKFFNDTLITMELQGLIKVYARALYLEAYGLLILLLRLLSGNTPIDPHTPRPAL